MNIQIDLNPHTFRKQLLQKLANNVPDDELDEIDDWLHKFIESSQVDLVSECAKISSELLKAHSRPWPAAYAMNTLLVSYLWRGNITKVRETLTELIDHSIKHNTFQAGLSGVHNAQKNMAGLAQPDYLMHLLSEIVRFYEHFDLFDDAISATLSIASLLGDYGAFQPAYHALGDAEKLARDRRDARQLAKVLGVLAGVAILEGDHQFAENVAQKAADLYRALSLEPPDSLSLNQATLAMKDGKHKEALEKFRQYARSDSFDASPNRIAVWTNMSICLRNVGEHDEAEKVVQEARRLASLDQNVDPEQLIELELVAAANAEAVNRPMDLEASLSKAAKYLDEALSTVDKLHYRRALRERYISRMESLLCSLPENGSANQIVEILACTRGNQLTDWLHMLEWAEELSLILTKEENSNLDELIFRLANFGAPFLQGYREKYNDPLARAAMPDPWKEFSENVGELCRKYKFRHPFSAACMSNSAQLLNARLREGIAFIVSILPAGKAVCLIDNRYNICELPSTNTFEFLRALHGHRQRTTSTKEFSLLLGDYQNALRASFKHILQQLNLEECSGVTFLPDLADLLPINLLIIGDTSLRKRMANGDFEVRTCPALYPKSASQAPLKTLLTISEELSDLKLDSAQCESFSSILGLSGKTLTNASSSDVIETWRNIDAILLAQHGISVGLFVDPGFANMREVGHAKDAIYFDSIQQSAYKSMYRLVMLSACHSGTLISRNAQGQFKSHELAGYPSIFLTNRNCVVTASAWATIDRFDYLLSTQFAITLKTERNFGKAFSMALAKVVDMSATEASRLFDHIPDPELRKEMTPDTDTRSQQITNLISQPFCYGAYNLYSLV